MDLVSKRDYPLYYTMIKTPISMNMIKKRLNSTYYRTIAHFRDDFHLMFNNARTFNEEGSFVYEDANEMQVSFTEYIFHMHTKKLIQRIFDAKLEELCPGGVLTLTPSSSNNHPDHMRGYHEN